MLVANVLVTGDEFQKVMKRRMGHRVVARKRQCWENSCYILTWERAWGWFFIEGKKLYKRKNSVGKRVKWGCCIPKEIKRWRIFTHRIRNYMWMEQKKWPLKLAIILNGHIFKFLCVLILFVIFLLHTVFKAKWNMCA